MTPEEKAAGMISPQDVDFGHGPVMAVYRTRKSWSLYWLAELLSCGWCASGWVSGAVTAAVDIAVGIPSPWLVGPAVWGAAAWLLSQE